MTITVNIDERDITVRELLAHAAPGDEVLVQQDGRVVGRLHCEPKDAPQQKRVFGRWEGQGWISPDFDAPMSEDELALWYDRPLSTQ